MQSVYTDHPREIPARRTPLSTDEAAQALWAAYVRVFGNEPSRETLAIMLAQTGLETGRWQKIYGHNFGNKKAGPHYPGLHQYFRCNEVINGRVQWFDPPHGQTRFRAYATAADGAEAYIRFIGTDTNGGGNRYGAAWEAAMRGEPEEFSRALARTGYYTANADRYTLAVVSMFHEFMARDFALGHQPDVEVCPERSPLSDADIELLPLDLDWEELRAARDRDVQGS